MPDITASRHKGNAASRDAYLASQPFHARDRERILALMATKPNGLTSKEACEELEMVMQTASGRFAELEKDGLIYGLDIRRNRAEAHALVREPLQLSFTEVA